jgi:hypothetical protein
MYEVSVHEPSDATSRSSHIIYTTPKTKSRTRANKKQIVVPATNLTIYAYNSAPLDGN